MHALNLGGMHLKSYDYGMPVQQGVDNIRSRGVSHDLKEWSSL